MERVSIGPLVRYYVTPKGDKISNNNMDLQLNPSEQAAYFVEKDEFLAI